MLSPTIRTVSLVLCLLLAGGVWAAPKKNNKNKNKNAPKPQVHPTLRAMFGESAAAAKMNNNQQMRLLRLTQQHQTKISAIQKKSEGVYTKEQQELIANSRRMAIRAGVNPQNIDKRVQEAISTIRLSDEQKTAMAAVKAEKAALMKEIRTAAGGFLSPLQIRQLFGASGGSKKKK